MKSRRTSVIFLNDWLNARNRHSNFTLLNVSGDWLRGEWMTCEITVLGLGFTVTRWSRKPYVVSGFSESPFAPVAEAAASIYGLTPRESFQFHEDNWPEGVPVESLGREHAP